MPGRAYSSSGIILQKVAVFCVAPWLVFTLPLTVGPETGKGAAKAAPFSLQCMKERILALPLAATSGGDCNVTDRACLRPSIVCIYDAKLHQNH